MHHSRASVDVTSSDAVEDEPRLRAFKMVPTLHYILPRLSNTYLERTWYHIIS